jgi:hypothetical protein
LYYIKKTKKKKDVTKFIAKTGGEFVRGSRFNVDKLKRVINFFKYFEIDIEL